MVDNKFLYLFKKYIFFFFIIYQNIMLNFQFIDIFFMKVVHEKCSHTLVTMYRKHLNCIMT